MTNKSYSKSVSKERLATYKKHFEHLNLLKPTTKPSQASAGSAFLYSNSKKTTGNLVKTHLIPGDSNTTEYSAQDIDLTADLQYLTDEYLDQCIHEWATWLAQTELRARNLRTTTDNLSEARRPSDEKI
jgi:hypothetical protein